MRVRKTADDRKAEILKAAMDIAFELGPSQVTTGEIADRLGLTQPALYKHFKNKKDVWEAIASNQSDQISNNIAAAEQSSMTPETRIRTLVLDHLRLVHGFPALPEIMVMRDASDGQRASTAAIKAAMSEFRIALIRNIEAAQQDGSICQEINTNDAATLIFGIIQSLALRLLLTRDPSFLLTDGERLLNLQLSLFAENEYAQ